MRNFLEDGYIGGIEAESLMNLMENISEESLQDTLSDKEVLALLRKFIDYESKVRDGMLSMTAQFWVSVIDHTHLLMMLSYVGKVNDLSLFHYCNVDQNIPTFILLFRKLGEDWSVTDTLVEELEEFTCTMYGYAHEKSVNLVHHLMLQKMVGEDMELTTESKTDLSKLPPDRDSLA